MRTYFVSHLNGYSIPNLTMPCSWIVFIVERAGALATGFPSTIRDEDILTPFGKPLNDISSVRY